MPVKAPAPPRARSAKPEADPLITPQELADELRVPVNTLYVWRSRGKGPDGFRVGKHLRYRRSAVTSWRREQGDIATPGQR